jgi:hypothetical protein
VAAPARALRRELAARGVSEYRVGLIDANDAAIDFYAGRGLTVVSRVLLGRIG